MVGPSGSGKSTFLRCINHLETGQRRAALRRRRRWSATAERATSCTRCTPREAAKQRRDIGMVFQHFNLFPHMTALREHHRGADPGEEA